MQKIIGEIYDKADKNSCEIVTPLDFAVSESVDGEANFKDFQDTLDEMVKFIFVKLLISNPRWVSKIV